MGTQEVELERAGEKSAVDGSDPVCSFIHDYYYYSSRSDTANDCRRLKD